MRYFVISRSTDIDDCLFPWRMTIYMALSFEEILKSSDWHTSPMTHTADRCRCEGFLRWGATHVLPHSEDCRPGEIRSTEGFQAASILIRGSHPAQRKNYLSIRYDAMPCDIVTTRVYPLRSPSISFPSLSAHLLSNCSLFVGDCIHTVKPYFGVGVNSALEDVMVLNSALNRWETWWCRVTTSNAEITYFRKLHTLWCRFS